MLLTVGAIAATTFAAGSPFATRVLEYRPAPGQFINTSAFGDPARALGAPVGGGLLAADNTSVVSLGGFGGSITLGFDHPIPNKPSTAPGAEPANPHGLDLIVFGNAFYAGGNVNRRFAECAVIEVARDSNGNGIADDPWFLIPGSHLSAQTPPPPSPPVTFPLSPVMVTWDTDTGDAMFPPANATWIPSWVQPVGPPNTLFYTWSFELPAVFGAVVLVNPLGTGASTEAIFGYADHTPTPLLGDTDADNIVDDAAMTAEVFYTRPDDPFVVGISAGSSGGDAFDISWAIDPGNGLTVSPPLAAIDFVRIRTAVNIVAGAGGVGEFSSDIDAVAEVLPHEGPVFARSDVNRDGEVTADDIFAFLDAWFAESGQGGPGLLADINVDLTVTADDIFAFLDLWFARA